jgi:PAS domain S-box-containing protein
MSSTNDIDQQVQNHIETLTSVNDRLQNGNFTLPRGILDDLSLLTHHLKLLKREIIKLDDERQDLLSLAQIGKIINSSLKLNDVLRIVMDTLIRLTEAERGFLMLRDQETGKLVTQIARNWEQESIAPNEFAISRTVINRVADGGEPILTTNAQEDPRFDNQDSIVAYKLRSIVCVPLTVKDRLIGVIYADNRIQTGLFSKADLTLLTAFGNQAAVAIENARLFESVRETLAEVTELKNLMDNIFSSIASGVITTDVHDHITLCNKATEKILRTQSQKLVGQKLEEALPPLGDKLKNKLARVRQENRSIIGMEVSSTLSTNKHVDLSLNISPLKDAEENTQGVAIVLDDMTEKKRLEAERRLFERMVSPAVIKQLNPNQLQLGGKRAQITTLFADVRGFTHFSEKLPPEDLVSILNAYLAAAAEAVLYEEGTIDKFMGDAVMAWFNAPIPQEDHTLRAVRAALHIRQRIQELHERLPEQYHLSFGIGVHTGDAVLGLIGTEKRIEYTAIGDSVNTAKRIQENARNNQILISADLYHHIQPEVVARPAAPINAKGKRKPVEAYEVLNLR